MTRRVVDASVVVKLFFDEEHSKAAEKHVKQAGELLAPDLIWAEAANVVWKRVRRHDITPEEATGITQQLLALPIHVCPSADLVADALELAVRFDRSVYDGLYLALAVRRDCPLLTADQRLFNALSETPLARHVRFVGSAPRGTRR